MSREFDSHNDRDGNETNIYHRCENKCEKINGCFCYTVPGPQGIPGEKGETGATGATGVSGVPGITTLAAGLNLGTAITANTTVTDTSPIPLAQFGAAIGTSISYTAPNITVIPGVYYFSWNVLAESGTTASDIVISLVNTAVPTIPLATSGLDLVVEGNTAGGSVNGSVVLLFTATTTLNLINTSGTAITNLFADGDLTNNYSASMTILRLA